MQAVQEELVELEVLEAEGVELQAIMVHQATVKHLPSQHYQCITDS